MQKELQYYYEVVRNFKLQVPEKFSFPLDVFDKWGSLPALIWTDGKEVKRFTFEELTALSSKLAGGLKNLGIGKGDNVLMFLPNRYEWWITVLALMRLNAVIVPSTVMLTVKDLEYRLKSLEIKAIISDEENAKKVEEAVNLTNSKAILINIDDIPGWEKYSELFKFDPFVGERTFSEDTSIIFFTSGTTGPPKMVRHTQVSYPLAHVITGKFWLNLKPGIIHWNLSDTGWAKAAWSSLFGPWNTGATVFVRRRGKKFTPDIMIETLKKFEVTSLCAPPTVYRMLIKEVPLKELSFPTVNHFVSAGEPLNPEVIDIWKEITGKYIYNGYGQTETVNTIAMFPFIPMRKGAMGLPTPGFEVEIVDDNGKILKPYEEGNIAIKVFPERPVGLFKEYINDEKEMAAAFKGEWYFTRDRGYKDEDGYFWFLGREDDIIISSGYRISPFEVESVLIKHPAVKECAVVASPDEIRGEVVKAFIVLKDGFKPSPELIKELQNFVKTETAPYKYPRKIEFVEELPKTVSGKIKRKELKLKEFGLWPK
ncbi:MAG: SA protein [Thermodesulfobacterium sp. 37_54]|uniref:Acyl-CoA synthetase n=1 Tax=Thermodesulfobacterium commune TaxID=1741 RepID=A0A101FIK9_9BACT|nr:MAG: SA protein [Thermodesulfobacterium sp. 37_54]KUK19934.1 MAG: SA protein [Thermodesulfobacterium commune]MDK2860927.1 acetyl-CoA synthetase [Thermodesulfobacterium sp.]KUK37698.1 MAG: SA protein [Thermodesulfobacterium commune]HAA83276.1 acyl-CoA synthetase [Thermodesulfobacterium commune]